MQANYHDGHQMREENISAISHFAIRSPGRLKRFLRRWEKNDDDIDDIISSALLNALRCIHTFTGQSSIETWFYGVCKNTARQHVAARMHSCKNIFQLEDIEDIDQSAEDHGALSLEEKVYKMQQLKGLIQSISKLPQDQQDIFQAIYIDGISYDTLARELNIPIGTIKSRINRMRTTLLQKSVLHRK